MNVTMVSTIKNDWQPATLRSPPATVPVSDQTSSGALSSQNSGDGSDASDVNGPFPSLEVISRHIMETMQKVLDEMAREAAERQAERTAQAEAQKAAQAAAEKSAAIEQLQQSTMSVAQTPDGQTAAPVLGSSAAPAAAGVPNNANNTAILGRKPRQATTAKGVGVQMVPPSKETIQRITRAIQQAPKAEIVNLHRFKPATLAVIA
jgi:hypothetical protein